MPGGPQPMDQARRLQLSYEIAQRVGQHYRDAVLALGIFGSVARGTHGPYSDVEIHCVLHGKGYVTAHEWSVGPWKAEVDVYTQDVILEWAAEVDVDWPLTHRAFTGVLTIFDPTDFFTRLRITALSQPEEVFQRTMRDVIVGEVYERIGKVRNAHTADNLACLPYLAMELAKFGACLIGLANRHLYASGSHLFKESLSLPGRPGGYDALCQMVMAGELAAPRRIVAAADAFWSGIETWAQARGMCIEHDLDTLLRHAPVRSRKTSWQEAIAFVRARGDQLEQLRLRRALGERFTLAEVEAIVAPAQLQNGSFSTDAPDGRRSAVGSLADTIHWLRWLREFDLGSRSQMVRTLDFLASVQSPDGSFYETAQKLAHSPQEWLKDDTLVDRFFFTSAVAMRLFSLGYGQHPLIQPALRWLRHYWSDWTLITRSRHNLWALLCIARAPIGLGGSAYQRCYGTALRWLPELDPRQLTWLLDALQGAGFSSDEPLVAKGLERLSTLQSDSGVWQDVQAPVETTITALRLLRDYALMPIGEDEGRQSVR